jgi:hypothetical protein
MTISSRLDAIAARLSKVPMPVRTRLALELSAALAVRADTTRIKPKDAQQMTRKSEHVNERKEKVFVEVTNQVAKNEHGNYQGTASFYWKNDPKKMHHSVTVHTQGPAHLRIQSHKLLVKPKDGGEEYEWGGDEEQEKAEDKEPAEEQPEKKAQPVAPPVVETKHDFPGPDGKKPPKDIHLDPHADEDGDGVADAARVGIPAALVAPPPKLPRLRGLSDVENSIQDEYLSLIESDPERAAKDYFDYVKARQAKSNGPATFVTDDVKFLNPTYLGSNEPWVKNGEPVVDKKTGKQKIVPTEDTMAWRAKHNVLLHQGANAIAKKAFLMHLDELAKLEKDDPKRSVLVTSGGCGSGKGFSVKNGPGPIKELKDTVGAIWDAAGEQNATENPWIMEECKKRGLKPTYVYVDADPMRQWTSKDGGVVQRANDREGEGRMVDARLFADSYALGAKNFSAFHEKMKDEKDENGKPLADFIFINTWENQEPNEKGQVFPKIQPADGLDERSLKLDSDHLTAEAMKFIEKHAPNENIKYGATVNNKLWPSSGEAKTSGSAWRTTMTVTSAGLEEEGRKLRKQLIKNFDENLRAIDEFIAKQTREAEETAKEFAMERDGEGKLKFKDRGQKTKGSADGVEQTVDNMFAEGCENYDDSQDVCLDDELSPSARVDIVTEAVAQTDISRVTKAKLEIAAAALAALEAASAEVPPGAYTDYGSMLNFLRSMKVGTTFSLFFKKGSSPTQRRVLVVETSASQTKSTGDWSRTAVYCKDKKQVRRPLQRGGPIILDYGPTTGLMFQATMNQKVIPIIALIEGDEDMVIPEEEVVPTMKPAMASTVKALSEQESAYADDLAYFKKRLKDQVAAFDHKGDYNDPEPYKTQTRIASLVHKMAETFRGYVEENEMRADPRDIQKAVEEVLSSVKDPNVKKGVQMALEKGKGAIGFEPRDKKKAKEHSDEAHEGADLNPDEYKREFGRCPPGFHTNEKDKCDQVEAAMTKAASAAKVAEKLLKKRR